MLCKIKFYHILGETIKKNNIRTYFLEKIFPMNFWIFGSNKTIIAYDKTPVIKAVSARWASLLVIDLNLGIKNFTLNNNVITCHKQKVATVISKYEFINNIFNPKPKPQPKPQPVNPIEVIEAIQPEEPIIIEEIPEEEIKVDEPNDSIPFGFRPDIKIMEPKDLSHIDVPVEERVEEKVEESGFEVIIQPEPMVDEPPILEEIKETPIESQPEPIVEEPAVIEEAKPEPVEEPKPKKKRKYTKRKKSNKE